MRILSYNKFLNENITTTVKELINSINGQQVDPFYEIGLDKDRYLGKDIDFLYDDSEFNRKLFDKDIKKGELVSTKETESFLIKKVDLKYFFLYKRNKSKIDDPDYIILQFNEISWSKIYMFKVDGSVRNFLEKLTSKTIELTYMDETYIYQTSNSGNNWILQNIENENEDFKEEMENDEIRDLLKNNDIKLKVID